jgi:hypothetical protein
MDQSHRLDSISQEMEFTVQALEILREHVNLGQTNEAVLVIDIAHKRVMDLLKILRLRRRTLLIMPERNGLKDLP